MGLVSGPFEESLPDWFGFIKCGSFCPTVINNATQGPWPPPR